MKDLAKTTAIENSAVVDMTTLSKKYLLLVHVHKVTRGTCLHNTQETLTCKRIAEVFRP